MAASVLKMVAKSVVAKKIADAKKVAYAVKIVADASAESMDAAKNVVAKYEKMLAGTVFVIKEVYCCIQGLSENNEFRERIEKNLKRLEKVASVLNELQEDEAYKATIACSLGICESVCATLRNHTNPGKFINVHRHRRELETLESELRKAGDNLQLGLFQALFTQNKRLKEELQSVKENLQRCYQETRRDVIHPSHGVFLPNGRAISSCPLEIEQPRVCLDESGNCMVVEWSNDKNTINRYNVRYDVESGMVVSAAVEECMLVENLNLFSIRLGSPKIKLGGLYTVQVRGINGAGAGNWSKPTIFRFKAGPPNKPMKPTATALSPTEIEITASTLSQKDENGSSVTHCTVEYTQKIDGNRDTLHFPIPNEGHIESVKFKIGSLQPETTYCFRIKMENCAGESPPSDSLEVMTTQCRPSPPQNLCISSKRTATTIKISWKESAQNPQAACMYNVQMRPEKAWEWNDYDPVKEKSMEFTQLESNTRYLFRVRSTNNKGEAGEWSNEIEAKTRVSELCWKLAVLGTVIGVLLLGWVFIVCIRGACAYGYGGAFCDGPSWPIEVVEMLLFTTPFRLAIQVYEELTGLTF